MRRGVALAWVGALAACLSCAPHSPAERSSGEQGSPSPRPLPDRLPAPSASTDPVALPIVAPPEAPRSPWAFANVDPNDDQVIGPPETMPDCASRLAAAGIRSHVVSIGVHKEGKISCGAPQVVSYDHGPTTATWSSPPAVTCIVALGMARFETILQEEAQRRFSSKVKRITHLGSYSCRPMVRFDLVSEHSYVNAIDVQSIELENGKKFSIFADWGPPADPPVTPGAQFLHSVGHRLYDEDVFSNVLSPAWDNLHKDHLHLDQGRYRVDGTRVRQ